MTEQELSEIEARANAATPGSWDKIFPLYDFDAEFIEKAQKAIEAVKIWAQ